MPQETRSSHNEAREVTTTLHKPCHVVEVEPQAEQCREGIVEKHNDCEAVE